MIGLVTIEDREARVACESVDEELEVNFVALRVITDVPRQTRTTADSYGDV